MLSGILKITDFQFIMTDDQIKELFADSVDGGKPQSRWYGAIVTTYKAQDHPKQLQLVNKPRAN